MLESKVRAKEVRTLLNSRLPEGMEFAGTFQDAEAVCAHNGVNPPFGALSDGYRSYIGPSPTCCVTRTASARRSPN